VARERRGASVAVPYPRPNNALQLTAYSLRFAALRFGFRQQLKAGVRREQSMFWHIRRLIVLQREGIYMGILGWLFSRASQEARHESLRMDNEATRLLASGVLTEFVREKSGLWNHQDWLSVLARVRTAGYTGPPDDEVGRLLEEEKARFLGTSHPTCKEITQLHSLTTRVIVYLVTVSLISFIVGYFIIGLGGRMAQFFALALIGFSGSSVAALVSCLDRYATGFELENGMKVPKDATGETFNRRMSRWFFARPFLGVVVAPVLVWGIIFFVKEPEKFKSSSETLAFTAFLAGLLAKSVLGLIKDLFKSVFKT
jgi:hypothetical protein